MGNAGAISEASFVPTHALGDSAVAANVVGPWLLSAWAPYAEELFGSAEGAAQACTAMMLDRASELSLERAEVLIVGGRARGALMAMSGDELKRAHKNDFLRMMQRAGRAGAEAIRERLLALEGLVAPVQGDAFYLTHIAVDPAAFGHGFGRLLLSHFLDVGRSRGFCRFRLNVDAANVAAQRLYSSAGFVAIHRGRSSRSSLTYLTMELVETAPDGANLAE